MDFIIRVMNLSVPVVGPGGSESLAGHITASTSDLPEANAYYKIRQNN